MDQIGFDLYTKVNKFSNFHPSTPVILETRPRTRRQCIHVDFNETCVNQINNYVLEYANITPITEDEEDSMRMIFNCIINFGNKNRVVYVIPGSHHI